TNWGSSDTTVAHFTPNGEIIALCVQPPRNGWRGTADALKLTEEPAKALARRGRPEKGRQISKAAEGLPPGGKGWDPCTRPDTTPRTRASTSPDGRRATRPTSR